MSLHKNGPMLCCSLRREDAEDMGARATAPGGYGNYDGRARGFTIETQQRNDGVTVFAVYALVKSR